MTNEFEYLVLDSGPLILNSIPFHLTRQICTVPEVLAELKDAVTRDRLTRLPLPLRIRSPSSQALQMVRDFARATGDLASLSGADLKVVALTLTLELEVNGEKSSARRSPVAVKTHQGAVEKESTLVQEKTRETSGSTEQEPKSKGTGLLKQDKDDAGEWITAENIESVMRKTYGSGGTKTGETLRESELIRVGCISSDFAVQNLLLQMKLKLYSPEGYRIKQVKNWLLRCHACYWTTKQMERRFCDHCGNPTLLRTSYKIDESGQTHLFLASHFQYKLRGSKTPLSMPKSGRKGNPILLREDQKEYLQAMKTFRHDEKKAKKDAGDMDALDDKIAIIFEGMRLSGSSWTSSQSPSLPAIGFGRSNPNERRRRV